MYMAGVGVAVLVTFVAMLMIMGMPGHVPHSTRSINAAQLWQMLSGQFDTPLVGMD
jgi:hypothetical protein